MHHYDNEEKIESAAKKKAAVSAKKVSPTAAMKKQKKKKALNRKPTSTTAKTKTSTKMTRAATGVSTAVGIAKGKKELVTTSQAPRSSVVRASLTNDIEEVESANLFTLLFRPRFQLELWKRSSVQGGGHQVLQVVRYLTPREATKVQVHLLLGGC